MRPGCEKCRDLRRESARAKAAHVELEQRFKSAAFHRDEFAIRGLVPDLVDALRARINARDELRRHEAGHAMARRSTGRVAGANPE
jgi:hypothetical protein